MPTEQTLNLLQTFRSMVNEAIPIGFDRKLKSIFKMNPNADG
jgi:hypothetical protein